MFFKRIYYFIGTVLLFTSCGNTRTATYFTGAGNATITANTPIPESVIQNSDILSITVSSPNPEASAQFNSPNISNLQGADPNLTASGYLVNTDGYIQFPVLGNIKAGGFTKEQLKEEIRKKLLTTQQLKDPIVNIRFLNFRVTVLGEVKNPAVMTVPNERISLLEAIGLAGDLTIYAKRDNILVIREEENKKILQRINLNSSELLSSPYYYLKSNDIVYVEPNKARVASAKNTNWIPVVFGSLSLFVIVIDRLIK
jgi:polysaccharide export outer membrane protein